MPVNLVQAANRQQLCKQYLPGVYEIEVIDLSKHPRRSRVYGIPALPAIVRRFSLPGKRVIGTPANGARAAAKLEMVTGKVWGDLHGK
jgi:circadian clock protein KaiB